jgi:hypothetical protein
VVDRVVAKVGSVAVAKAVRKAGRQFIAVTCHDDIIEWLEADWVFNTNTMTIDTVKKNDRRLLWMSARQPLPRGSCLASTTI